MRSIVSSCQGAATCCTPPVRSTGPRLSDCTCGNIGCGSWVEPPARLDSGLGGSVSAWHVLDGCGRCRYGCGLRLQPGKRSGMESDRPGVLRMEGGGVVLAIRS